LGEKRRREIRSVLHNAIKLDPKYVLELTGGEQFSGVVEKKLRALGAPEECYAIGPSNLDGRFMRLGDALGELMGLGNGGFYRVFRAGSAILNMNTPTGDASCAVEDVRRTSAGTDVPL
jgi:hypothetical protein